MRRLYDGLGRPIADGAWRRGGAAVGKPGKGLVQLLLDPADGGGGKVRLTEVLGDVFDFTNGDSLDAHR